MNVRYPIDPFIYCTHKPSPVGHIGRECPKPRDWSRVKCTNCQEMGHTQVKCQNPPKEEGEGGDKFDFRGDGGGGSGGGGDFSNALSRGDGYGATSGQE